MKKSLFIIAATALVISCSSNDVKNELILEDTPIGRWQEDQECR